MKKSLHNLTDCNYPLNYRRSWNKGSRGNSTICRFLQRIRFRIQKKRWKEYFLHMVASKNYYRCNDILQKHQSIDGDTDSFEIINGVLQSYTLTLYLFIVCQVYVLRKFIDLIKEHFFTLKMQEAVDTAQKLRQTQNTQSNQYFSHQPSQNPYYISKSKQQETLTPTQIKESICVLYESRCLWCNGYRRRKWTRRLEFKSWTRLIAFHIALIPLRKV